MKKVLKVMLALALGVVVTMFASTEAKADTYSDYLLYYGYYDPAITAAYENYYAEYARMQELQIAANYVNSANPYADPYTYYYYANLVTDNSLAHVYGSADAYALEVAAEMEYLAKQQEFLALNQQYVNAIWEIYNVYETGQQFLWLTGGVNPYGAYLEQSLNDYDRWLNNNQIYWNY